jgi:hypothetical protein
MKMMRGRIIERKYEIRVTKGQCLFFDQIGLVDLFLIF